MCVHGIKPCPSSIEDKDEYQKSDASSSEVEYPSIKTESIGYGLYWFNLTRRSQWQVRNCRLLAVNCWAILKLSFDSYTRRSCSCYLLIQCTVFAWPDEAPGSLGILCSLNCTEIIIWNCQTAAASSFLPCSPSAKWLPLLNFHLTCKHAQVFMASASNSEVKVEWWVGNWMMITMPILKTAVTAHSSGTIIVVHACHIRSCSPHNAVRLPSIILLSTLAQSC